MTAAEVLKLIDAGFSADEIRAMDAGTDDGQQTGEGGTDDAGSEDESAAGAGADDNQQTGGEDPTASRVDRIEKLIEKMAGAIIKGTDAGNPPDERDNGIKSLLEGM